MHVSHIWHDRIFFNGHFFGENLLAFFPNLGLEHKYIKVREVWLLLGTTRKINSVSNNVDLWDGKKQFKVAMQGDNDEISKIKMLKYELRSQLCKT